MNYLETATNCKMVFNASSSADHFVLNGKMVIQFEEIKDAMVELYAWPNTIPADSPTHGILDNGIHFTPKFGDKYSAPTDWTIYV